MSDAETDPVGRGEIWIEKYRPDSLSGVVGHPEITDRLKRYVAKNDLPNLLFSGPAGVGKCITGETPVLTNRGVERIGDIAGDVDGFGTPDEGLEVATFDRDGEISFAEPSRTYGKETDELVAVRTRDGGVMEVTPEHPLLVIDHDGLSWTPAEELDPGDRIARPLSLPTPESDDGLDWIEAVDPERIFVTLTESFAAEHDVPIEENHVGHKRRVLGRLRRGDSVDEIDGDTDVPRKTIQCYEREFRETDLNAPATACSLAYLRNLDLDRAELLGGIESIRYVSRANNRRSRPITPPEKLSTELAEFVGLAISEARIDGGRIQFYNEDESLLRQFEEAARDVFGVETTRGENKGVPYVEIGSRTLTHFLEACFDAFSGATTGAGIGSTLVGADTEVRSAFLRAVFDAEGYVATNGIVELTQKNERLITLLSYLLASVGITARRKTERKAAINGSEIEREYHTLFVSGARDLARFEDAVGFTLERKADRLAEAADREGNPNHDTIPVQQSVDALCDSLYLNASKLKTETLDPETPGRENYLDDLRRVRQAALAKLETAQDVCERLDRLRGEIGETAAVPTAWITTRDALEPIETRREVSDVTGIRSDYLLEYADGRRSPRAARTDTLLGELDAGRGLQYIESVQAGLREAIASLNVPHAHLAEETPYYGTDFINLLDRNDHALSSLPRFHTLTEQVRACASKMLSGEVLADLRNLETVVDADLHYDTVESIERIDRETRVYDLTVPGTHNYVAGTVPIVMHNTASATAIAREMYGEDWSEYFLELNASDQRGIDVVRDRIKSFARSSFGGAEYRIIFLDEADALCVPPGTEVVTGYPSSPEVKPIEDVSEEGEPIPSVDFETNEIQSDKGRLVDSGVADFFELELGDGRTITASLTHPFFVVGEDGKLVEKELRELTPGDEIADFKDEIGVSTCEICGDWTAGRFCSVDCKDEGHSREMEGQGNPMYGTEWSDERREKIVEKLSDGRLEGENNPNYGGKFHGVPVWEMEESDIERFRETLSEMRSGTSWEEWVVDADPETVKQEIGKSTSEWWDSIDDEKRARLIEKSVENCDYPVRDITGDNNPMRDPEIAQKVSDALQDHEPTGGNIRHSEELGHLVRSDWEYEVAKSLQDAGIEYEYEPEFELSDSVFHPDFLIDDTVIGVKGVAKLWGQTGKVEEFLDTYGDEYTFVVVGDGDLPHHQHYHREEFDPALVSDGGRGAVQTTEIRRIEHSHRGKAYNITMENTPNFMLGNGILTHNTSQAQSALRRTMEQFSHNTRFILSCNYSSEIIDPIQSRCAVFRFAGIDDDAVATRIEEIADEEGIEHTRDGIDALVYAADGDMRKAINALQAAAVMGETVDEDAVYTITATARPEEIEAMVTEALAGNFTAARSTLDSLLTEKGLAGGDVIDQLHRSVWEFDLDEEAAVRLLDRVGEADYRIAEGANERVQLEALLASVALENDA